MQNLPDFYSSHSSVIKINGNPIIGLPNKKKRIALVAQGGGQRGIFTAGVLDSFIEEGFDPFEMYFGTSAGALNLSSYLARNYGFAYRFITQFTTKNEFFNLIKYVRRRQSMDLNWAISAVDLSNPDVLRVDRARQLLKNRKAYACATELSTLSAHFFPMFQDNWVEVLKATSAIPLLHSGAVEIAGKKYIDGGVSAAIPAREAYSRGADIIVVIRTEAVSADKKPISATLLENLRSSVERHLPQYLDRFNLENHKEKLHQYHASLSKRLQALRNKYTHDAWEHIKEKFPHKHHRNGGRWLFSGNSIYRLQALSGRKINLDMVNMLTRHYQSYQEGIKFLQSPPARVQIIQLCPSGPLASSALLSKHSHLVQDYHVGAEVGKLFVKQFGHTLNSISNIEIS